MTVLNDRDYICLTIDSFNAYLRCIPHFMMKTKVGNFVTTVECRF